ncbi:MAG: response regulator [Patescibacteria group bacterium]
MTKILLIEDDVLMRRMYQRIFTEKEGFQFEAVETGEEGLDKIKKSEPDLVLLDLMLPKMPGEQVLKNMNDADLLKKIPVIVLSCKGDETTVEHCLNRLGASDYLHKSGLKPEKVIKRVKGVLKKFESG